MTKDRGYGEKVGEAAQKRCNDRILIRDTNTDCVMYFYSFFIHCFFIKLFKFYTGNEAKYKKNKEKPHRFTRYLPALL